MDEDEGEGEGAREFAQGGQDGGYFRGVVFVGRLQADVGIEDEQPRLAQGEGGAQAIDIVRAINAERGLENEVEFERRERGMASVAELLDALAHLQGRILGGVEEDGPGRGHGEAAQAAPSGGDGDREFEGEPALATSCRVPDYAASRWALAAEPGGSLVHDLLKSVIITGQRLSR